ncbi:MAG: hypothetical protein IMZ47_07270 [Firmicutes bacterium]|nr:hypothetical protein [Bacillota bacterium]
MESEPVEEGIIPWKDLKIGRLNIFTSDLYQQARQQAARKIEEEYGFELILGSSESDADVEYKWITDQIAAGVFCKLKFLTFANIFPQAPVGNFFVSYNESARHFVLS